MAFTGCGEGSLRDAEDDNHDQSQRSCGHAISQIQGVSLAYGLLVTGIKGQARAAWRSRINSRTGSGFPGSASRVKLRWLACAGASTITPSQTICPPSILNSSLS